jgi:hypothetical protein
MNKSITLKIDSKTYCELERIALESGRDIEEALAWAIKMLKKHRRQLKSDPFFTAPASGESGSTDVSEKHDKYLYDRKN